MHAKDQLSQISPIFMKHVFSNNILYYLLNIVNIKNCCRVEEEWSNMLNVVHLNQPF